MEYANTKRLRPPKNDDQLLNIGVRLRKLEENAIEKGEVALVVALAKPFQRLIKYHFLFRNLLFHADLATSNYHGVLKMLTKIEAIAGGIEVERIRKNQRLEVWDVLGRIDGLDKVKQLAALKPSRFLVEERRVPAGSSGSGFNGVEDGRCTFERPGVGLQSEDWIGEDRDLWLVVFNDVVLRCQRIATVSLPGWGAIWSKAIQTPEEAQRAVYPTTTIRTRPLLKPGNLYKFLEACFIVHIVLGYPTDEPFRSRHGILESLSGDM